MHFLVVDDNPLLNRFMHTFFHSKGQKCSSLTNPLDVEGWLASNNCDGIVMDIGMPQIDGVSLVSLIRQNNKTVPIVIFTALGYEEDLVKAAEYAGANGFVSKAKGADEVYNLLMKHIPGASATA